MSKIEMVGKKFARLTVVQEAGKDKSRNRLWKCICDCGGETISSGVDLRRGKARSCGCYQKEVARQTCLKRNITHGMTGTRIFNIWIGIRKRCLCEKELNYKNYGGRGITICQEWQEDFSNFYAWAMDNGYDDELTIDRIDVNGNYEPSNCRWITHKEQSNNTRRNHFVSYNGVSKTIAQWAEITGINRSTIWDRLDNGWNEGEAFGFVERIKVRGKEGE